MDAVNDVLPGIRIMHKFISQKNLVVHKSCQNFIEEIQSYSWDQKAGDRGFDKPLKVGDHLQDATRYALATNFIDGSIDCPNEDVTLAQRKRLAFGNDSNPAANWQPFNLQGRF
jgi:hypothetical protein